MSEYIIQMQNGFTDESIDLQEVEACFLSNSEGVFIETENDWIRVGDVFGVDLMPELILHHEKMGFVACYMGDEDSKGDIIFSDGTRLKMNGECKYISTADGSKWGMVFGRYDDGGACDVLGYCKCSSIPLKTRR